MAQSRLQQVSSMITYAINFRLHVFREHRYILRGVLSQRTLNLIHEREEITKELKLALREDYNHYKECTLKLREENNK